MPSRRRTRRRRAATPPNLTTLLVLLVVLVVVWLYQEGYFDRLIERWSGVVPAVEAPELDDGTTPDRPRTLEPTVPQPSLAPAAAPAPKDQVETEALRGYAGAWYQVYFTKPRYPEWPATRSGGLDETIAADLDAAQRRIDLVVFDLELQRIADALLRAVQRGVQVRVVADRENMENPDMAAVIGQLQAAGIPLLLDEREAFMHNKFIVIDDAVVWTGSANLTPNDVYRNNNNMLRIVDQRLAQNYRAKADDLLAGGGGPNGGSVLVDPELTLDGARVATMFAPDDPITARIVERLTQARRQVEVLAFAFTSDPIADALLAARQRGVAVRVVMESRNVRGSGSEFERLQAGGVDIQSDGNCYIMHHKVIVIDGTTVVTGSFNFTRSAQEQNDENVLMVDDRSLAARYGEEFERVYAQALQPTRCG